MLRPAFFLLAMLTQDAPGARPEPKDAGWIQRHESFVAEARKGEIDLLLLGDSITDVWRQAANQAVWNRHFPGVRTANFGISGDRTQHLLWRLRNGELEGIQPKAAVLLIGTNNIGQANPETPASAIEGVKAVVREIREKLPKTKILLLALFPRAEKPDHPHRARLKEINDALRTLDDGGKTVQVLDIGAKFLSPDGTISTEIMPDFLHLTGKGYETWAAAMKEPLMKLLQGK